MDRLTVERIHWSSKSQEFLAAGETRGVIGVRHSAAISTSSCIAGNIARACFGFIGAVCLSHYT